MLWTNTKRIIKTGFVNFWRNGFVSLASILVMVITLMVIGSIIFTSTILHATLNELKDKVDINAYFTVDAPESDVLALKQELESRPEVESVEYISRDQALTNFKNRHQNDPSMQALDELSDNPLGAALNIKAHDPSKYAAISSFLESNTTSSSTGDVIIYKINYNQNEVAINTLSSLISGGQKLGLILTIILVAISIVITFNTIRLAIYISREEISVMRLVGAGSSYVRGPFIIIAMLYGAIAAIISMALFYPITFFFGRATTSFFINVNIYQYYVANFGQIFGILLGAGIVIGAVSSYLAVRRYLRV